MPPPPHTCTQAVPPCATRCPHAQGYQSARVPQLRDAPAADDRRFWTVRSIGCHLLANLRQVPRPVATCRQVVAPHSRDRGRHSRHGWHCRYVAGEQRHHPSPFLASPSLSARRRRRCTPTVRKHSSRRAGPSTSSPPTRAPAPLPASPCAGARVSRVRCCPRACGEGGGRACGAAEEGVPGCCPPEAPVTPGAPSRGRARARRWIGMTAFVLFAYQVRRNGGSV